MILSPTTQPPPQSDSAAPPGGRAGWRSRRGILAFTTSAFGILAPGNLCILAGAFSTVCPSEFG